MQDHDFGGVCVRFDYLQEAVAVVVGTSILRDLRRTVRSDEQQTAPETPTEY